MSHKELMKIYFPCLVNMFNYRNHNIIDLNDNFRHMNYEGDKWLEFLSCAIKVEKNNIIKVSSMNSYYNLYFCVKSFTRIY